MPVDDPAKIPINIDKRLAMMGQMMKATDTDLSTAASLNKLGRYNEMVSNCLDCPSPEACEEWLAAKPKHANAPGFCPNAKHLNR